MHLQEALQTAAQRAKAAVEGAQDQVQASLAELSQIQDKLESVRAQPQKPDPSEIHALEARLKEIQLGMTTTVEQAGKEVQQVCAHLLSCSPASSIHAVRPLSNSRDISSEQ